MSKKNLERGIILEKIKKSRESQDKLFIDNGEKFQQEFNFPLGGDLKKFVVYEISLEYLTFNQYNGRIASDTQTYEQAGTVIDPYTSEGEKVIREMLWESKKEANNRTLISLRGGQSKVAIITEDGVVIDGNRRSMLLKTNFESGDSKIKTLKTVILPISNLSRTDIEAYETQYQIGEEEKVDYNPINTYLKIRSMYNGLAKKTNIEDDDKALEEMFGENVEAEKKFDPENIDPNAIKQIFKAYGYYKTIQSEGDVKFALKVLSTMEDYLKVIENPGTYRLLYGREEQFRGLTKWLDHYKDCDSPKLFKEYKETDYENLRNLAYDYILIKTKNELFRDIGGRQQTNHVIGSQKAWKAFVSGWESIFRLEAREFNIDISTSSQRQLVKNIEAAENQFSSKFRKDLENNLKDAKDIVSNRKLKTRPLVLIQEGINKIEDLNVNSQTFNTPEVPKLLNDLIDKVEERLEKKSILGYLVRIKKMITKSLENIDEELDVMTSSELEEVKKIAKEISSKAYKIQKK